MSSLDVLYSFLTKSFVGREREIRGILASLVSKEPALLVANVGTAKTMIIETLAHATNMQYFYYLMTQFTEPEEIFGGWDLVALKEGKMKRVTAGKLPEAEIVFLDEIFKSSSAIRNTLLDVILNRRFEGKSIPLWVLYTASNEISTDKEDVAIYDRLTIRLFHDYVSDDYYQNLLELGLGYEIQKPQAPQIPKDVIHQAHEKMKALMQNLQQNVATSKVIHKYIDFLSYAKNEGIQISDRRKIKILKVACAYAVLDGMDTVTLDNLAEAIETVAVQREEDLVTIENIISALQLSENAEHIETLKTILTELQQIRITEDMNVADIKQYLSAVKSSLEKAQKIPENKRTKPYKDKVISECNRIKHEIQKVMGGF